MTIGEFIRLKRLAAKMTQTELYQHLPTRREPARLPQGGKSTISRIESSMINITLEQFIAIAQALGYKASDFLAEFESI